MDTLQCIEDKFDNIRLVIRQVILPLVEAIYIEDPQDIDVFCAQYFEDKIKQRHSDVASIEECDQQLFSTDTVGEKVTAVTDVREGCTRYSKGSASLSALKNEKHSEYLKLKETSSWNDPPKKSRLDNKNPQVCDLMDLTSKIGDQANLEVQHSDDAEFKVETGDTALNIKSDTRDDCNIPLIVKPENENLKNNCLKEVEDASDILPSAPPYEIVEETSRNNDLMLASNEQVTQNKLSSRTRVNVELETEDRVLNAEVHRKNSKSEETLENSDGNLGTELSPNSSFGFIAQLQNDSESNEMMDSPKEVPDLFLEVDNATKSINKLGKDITKVFKDLADKFNSAESNLDYEFQKVKEIGDVIHEQCLSKCDDRDNEVLKVADENITNYKIKFEPKENKLENKNYANETDINSQKIGKNESKKDNLDQDLHLKDIKRTKRYVSVSNSKEEFFDANPNVSSSGEIMDEVTDEKEMIKMSTESDEDINVEDINVEQIKNKPTVAENEKDFRKGSKNNNDLRKVDEDWRKRWYETHPCLDNITSSFRPEINFHLPRNLRNSTMLRSSIGEAGDVPRSQTFDAPADPRTGRFESNSESKLEVHSKQATIGEEYGNLDRSLSADEVHCRMNSKRMACNFSKKSLVDKHFDGNLRDKPYSWRERNAKPAQNKEPISKDDHLKYHKSNLKYYSKPEMNPKADVYDCRVSDTVVEVTELDGLICSADDQSSFSELDTRGNDFEYKIEEAEEVSFSMSELDDSQSQEKSFDGYMYLSQNNFAEDHKVDFEVLEGIPGNNDACEQPPERNNNAYFRNDSKKSSPKLEHSAKAEPGLISAGGDFTSANNTETQVEGQNTTTHSDINNLEMEDSTHETEPQAITAGYFEEVLRGVMNSKEAELEDYDVLNLVSYSETDSSNLEFSDMSDEDGSYEEDRSCD